jgi:DNA-binding CsgD family transcriptional regulator/PAS domain-containing protein
VLTGLDGRATLVTLDSGSKGMGEATASASVDAQLHDLLHRSPLALALLDLESMLIVDANGAARELISENEPVTFPVHLRDVLLPEDEGPAVRALQLVADGAIHSYDTRRRVKRRGGGTVAGHIWVRALPSPRDDVALVVFLPEADSGGDNEDLTGLPATRVSLSDPVVIGSIDAGTRFTQLSADARKVLGTEPAALLGEALVDYVHPDDLGALLSALGRAVAGNAGVGIRLRVKRADNSYVPLRALFTPNQSVNGTRFGFILTKETSEPSQQDARVAELEQHLWRIAAEVQAAGVVDNLHRLPDHSQLPGLAQLSTRQWQVLSGLMRGERVPDIARAMCVSQSTVRNHLGKIFQALGVHSQSELLALLRDTNHRSV